MILTGKCKEDFIKHHYNVKGICSFNLLEKDFESYIEIFKVALIIDWFDGKEIYINALKYGKRMWCGKVNYEQHSPHCFTRIEALKKGIIKANQIYNSL